MAFQRRLIHIITKRLGSGLELEILATLGAIDGHKFHIHTLGDVEGLESYSVPRHVSPKLAAEMLVEHLSSRMEVSEAEIFDAGCGTGLVGQDLRKLGVKTIDGCDISDRMRDIAQGTGVYRSLSSIDLNGFATLPDLKYDAVICVGTMTQGHVAREAFLDSYRLTKHKGLILVTIRDSVWEKNGYEDYVQHMVRTRMVNIISNPKKTQRIAAGVKAHFIVLESLSGEYTMSEDVQEEQMKEMYVPVGTVPDCSANVA